MTTIKDLSTAQLRRIIELKQQIEDLEAELESVAGGGERGPGRPIGSGKRLGRPPGKAGGKRKMSAAGRKAIAAAAKARWAAYRGEKGSENGTIEKPAKKRRKMSAEAKAKMAAAAKERWKKAKAAGKNSL